MSAGSTAAAIGLLVAGIGGAQADTLKPVEAYSIDLAGAAGNAYYTVEADGLHLVATLVHADTAEAPLRVHAVLAPGQSVTFSVPGAVGVAPATLEFSRRGDRLLVLRRARLN